MVGFKLPPPGLSPDLHIHTDIHDGDCTKRASHLSSSCRALKKGDIGVVYFSVFNKPANITQRASLSLSVVLSNMSVKSILVVELVEFSRAHGAVEGLPLLVLPFVHEKLESKGEN